MMAGDDFGGDPETEAVAGIAFGGEEGLEDARERVRGDSAAIVGDGDADSAAAGGPVCGGAASDNEASVGNVRIFGVGVLKRVCSALLEGVEGVSDEVEEDLSDFIFEARNGSDVTIAAQEADVMVLHAVTEE
jgi:hypothetical protein